MIQGYVDAKPGGVFSEEELFRSTHANRALGNQRLFAASRFLDWQRIPAEDANIGKWVVDNSLAVGGETSFVNLMMTPNVATSVCKYANAESVIDITHSQTATNINAITALSGRPGDRTWFGLNTDAGETIGYLYYTGSGWGNVARASGAPTGVAVCGAMAYSPTLDRIVASWDNNTPEYNSSGTTWTQANSAGDGMREIYWGGSHFVGARATTGTNQVYWTTDGITWSGTALGMTVPGSSLLAYDSAASTWYVMGSDMSGGLIMLNSTSPATSWNQIPSMVVPCTTSNEATSFIVDGGTIAIMVSGRLYVSSDLGQTWVRGHLPFDLTSAQCVVRRAGGKAYVLSELALFVSTGSFPPFSESI